LLPAAQSRDRWLGRGQGPAVAATLGSGRPRALCGGWPEGSGHPGAQEVAGASAEEDMSGRREVQGLEKVARRGQCRLVSEPETRYQEEIVARVSDHQQIAELGHRR